MWCKLLIYAFLFPDLNEVPVSSRLSFKPWENTALGWINNPTRPSGIFYNSVLPKFYQSFWQYYPDTKQFRAAFIIERCRQFNVKTQVESLSKKINYLLSDINPACAGLLLKADYSPKPGDRAIINLTKENNLQLKALIEKIETELNTHDASLFINAGRKMKSGRECHHDFNNSMKVELSILRTRIIELNRKLEKSEEIYKAVWAHKYKPTGISEAKKRINNKFKAEKRRKRSMLDKVLRVFISLGGEADGEYYSPAFGIPQITNLAIPLEDLTHSNLTDCLELLVKDDCFVESALEEVQLFLVKHKREDSAME